MQVIKSGDTAVVFSATLVKDDGEAWSLSGATVYFVIKKDETSYVFNAEVVSAVDKTVRYVVDEAEFPTKTGIYSQEWKVVFSDGTILRFPNNTYNKFAIKARLDT